MIIKKTFVYLIFFVITLLMLSGCLESGNDIADTVEPIIKNNSKEILVSQSPKEILPQEVIVPDTDWVPDILAGDTGSGVPDVDDSIKYDYSYNKLSFVTGYGNFTESKVNNSISTYTSAGTSILYTKSMPFPYGTFTCDIKTKTSSDNGIIFGLTTPYESFWEGKGISYYFFFLNKEGNAYLGKSVDGSWYLMKQVPYAFNETDTYTLKVVYQGSKICCYINGEFMMGMRDISPLTGTAFGLRCGDSGVIYSNMSVTNDYIY